MQDRQGLREYFDKIHRNATLAFDLTVPARCACDLDKAFDERRRRQVVISLEKNRLADLIPGFLLRSWSAFRSGLFLGAGGEIQGVFPLVRLCIENAGYASLLLQKPECLSDWSDPRKRRKTFGTNKWIRSIQDQDFRKKVEWSYERTIDLGAHPNEGGFDLAFDRRPGGRTYHMLSVADRPHEVALTFAILGGWLALGMLGARIPEYQFFEKGSHWESFAENISVILGGGPRNRC